MTAPTRRHGLAAARRIAVELTPQTVEQIATRVAQLMHHQQTSPTGTPGWMTAKELAAHLKINPAWVYEHAQELGAIRTGTGPKARIRFDLHTATQALKHQQPATATTRRKPTPRPTPYPTDAPLLEIRRREMRVRSCFGPRRRVGVH
ncbi:MAG: hypothetical protein ABR992_00015 [Solirubrobacteraceae bacterium]|jgi:hypothetical protein